MAHLITSHKGTEHVESKHVAHWNAGTLGNGCYVLPIGSKLACTMTDSNTLRVLFGVGSVCGYDWEIEGDYEEVDIDNGVPGYNRIDLLVARVETAPAEKVELKVYKGEETTGAPVQPGYVQGDLNDGDTVCEMPICSVRVNGINPQAPEMLANESIDIMALLEEFRNYKSQCPFDVGDLYITAKAGNPGEKWPGTIWEQITGRFLRAANDLLTGGSDFVTLKEANLPSHAHGVSLTAASAGSHGHYLVADSKSTYLATYRISPTTASSGNWYGVFDTCDNGIRKPVGSTDSTSAKAAGAHSHSVSGSTGSTGSGTAFDNRPAYQDVYVWKRMS